MKNNTWLVKLTLHINGYEKSAIHVVRADNEDDAGDLALRGETHNEGDAGYDENGDYCDDDMVYVVASAINVTGRDGKTLERLL